jgi:4-hydroxy-2-oxoheptanedioate aldolase
MKSFTSTLRGGGPHFGLSIMYPSPGIIERIGRDWDWIWVDCQHGEIGYQDMLNLIRACDLVQRPALVRVAAHDPGAIGAALDAGASGVIVPLVNSASEAKAVVNGAKFPPLGERSFGGRRVIDRGSRLYAENANTDTLLVVQIESPRALERVDEIAAVNGVDALFYGPDDVMLRKGGRMDTRHPLEEVDRDLTLVAAACHRHGKLAVNAGAAPEMMALSIKRGFNLIVGGGDSGFLAAGSKRAAEQARAAVSRGAKHRRQVIVPTEPAS